MWRGDRCRAAAGPGRPCAGGVARGEAGGETGPVESVRGGGEASAAGWWPGPVTESSRGDRPVWSGCVSVRLKELLVCSWKYRCGGVCLF